MAIALFTEHGDQAVALLLEQYKNKPRIEGWLRSIIAEIQTLENVTWDVILLRLIDNAANAQLDVIGRLVGEMRRGHDDTTYRHYIAVRIRVNRSKGHASDVLEVLALLDTTPRTFDEIQPANMIFQFATPMVLDPNDVLLTLRDTKGGGVGLVMIVPTADADHQFLFSDVDEPNEPDHGYGDVDTPGSFGLLSAVYV